MEMSIEEALEYLTDFSMYSPYQEAIDRVDVYIEQMQADYEARLKADMVARLEDLKKEIAKLKSYESTDGQDLAMLADIGILLNQKINKLREGEL